MHKLYRLPVNEISKLTILFVFVAFISGCGGSSGGDAISDINPDSDPEFLSKARSVSFDAITIYDGHDVEDQDNPRAELDTTQLQSGQLITINIDLQTSAAVDDYAIVFQLLPESTYTLLSPGDTFGDIGNDEVYALDGEGFIDIGSAYLQNSQPGVSSATAQVKLPILDQDGKYKLLAIPSLEYLSLNRPINIEDVNSLPTYIDERIFQIAQYMEPVVQVAASPTIATEDTFTELEFNAEFDSNGFSIDPIFESKLAIDVTSASSEKIRLRMNWELENGSIAPMGLLSSDAQGNPVIDIEANFEINPTDVNSTLLPIVAYPTTDTHRLLLQQSTNMKNVGSSTPIEGKFAVEIYSVDAGAEILIDKATLAIPIVSQDNRVNISNALDITDFSILTADRTRSSCLFLIGDIDTGEFNVSNGPAPINVGQCRSEPSSDSSLWRYEPGTKQIANKLTDVDGDSLCITAHGKREEVFQARMINVPVLTLPPGELGVDKCSKQSVLQQFEMEGNKIRLSPHKAYLRAGTSSLLLTYNQAEANNFYDSDSEPLEINESGQLYKTSKYYDHSWGSADKAQVRLSYGGEAVVDYLPVIGSSAEGKLNLGVSLFSQSKDIVDVSFTLKRYFNKKLSLASANNQPITVENGAQLKIDIAGYELENRGSLVQSTVTQSFLATEDVDSAVLSQLPPGGNSKGTLPASKRTETFIDTTISVFGVPVTIEGGVNIEASVAIDLNSPGTRLGVSTSENLALSGFISAALDAYVVKAGIEGEFTMIDQTLSFGADGGFASEGLSLAFDIGSSSQSNIKAISGELLAFVEYKSPCWCAPPWKKKRKEGSILKAGPLFDSDRTLFSKRLDSTLIDY